MVVKISSYLIKCQQRDSDLAIFHSQLRCRHEGNIKEKGI
jgi:hypothetical protein